MEFTLKTKFKATAKEIYSSWLNSKAHTNMTGGESVISDIVGESFTAWDGYIKGENIVLEPYKKIVQSWRTTQFGVEEKDSQIEILLHESSDETELTLIHTNVPEDGEHYKNGWEDHYFAPMKKYFSK